MIQTYSEFVRQVKQSNTAVEQSDRFKASAELSALWEKSRDKYNEWTQRMRTDRAEQRGKKFYS
ncbi:hypothetical protein SAMN04487770_1639 [Butyrivibrio sp. ob235]|uniref:hypothetical protein n=1 Tax=Butyrivibrio sp. ob235 TaxID=1761780 RepID=UPI0008B10E8D|nr:hypothetical protein [Butyrivibrio sp. ob235]SEM67663.1 hypothetical protein SAMN04487770_1639 [Butyrivibrio sp. ob235]